MQEEQFKNKDFEQKNSPFGGWWASLGIFLLIFSCLSWLSPVVVPFLPLSIAWKGILITTIIILGEIAFVASIGILGKDFLKNFFKNKK